MNTIILFIAALFNVAKAPTLEGRVDLVRGGRARHESLDAVVDQFPRPSGIGHDRRPTAAHRLDLRQRQPLRA